MIASLLMAVSSACGGGILPTPTASVSNIDTGVKTLESILVGDVSFVDVQPNAVTVLVDTTIPVVCAAAYGVTTQYGQLATDSDMAGSSHSNHHPLLANLQPNTTYHIRLQGVGPDGSLYQSRDYTIQTPPGSAPSQATPTPAANGERPSGENLALRARGARITGVSSNFGGGSNSSAFGADNAIDGDPATQWSTNGDGDNAWIEITLASETEVNAIGFQTRTMGASAQVLSFQVVTDLAETYGPFTLSDASRVYYFYFPNSLRASKLRFEAVQTSGGNTGAAEIEVYGLVDGM